MAVGNTLLYVAFGVVICIAVYYTIGYVTGRSGKGLPSQTTYLKTQATALPISNYSSPLSVRCCFSFWIFINNLDPVTTTATTVSSTTIFAITDPSTASAKPAATLKLDNAAGLKFTKDTTKTYDLMDNFPLQKWTRLDLSFDNRTFDLYIDGKLLRSYQMAASLVTPATAVVQFGSIDAYISGFARTAEPMDPATAQANYYEGQKKLTGTGLPSFGVSVQLVKDTVVQKTFSLF